MFRDFAPLAVPITNGLVALRGVSLSGDSRNGQYMLIDAPWSGQSRMMDIIRGADCSPAALGSFADAAIARSSRSDFAARAKQGGAWLLLSNPRIAACFSFQSEVPPNEPRT